MKFSNLLFWRKPKDIPPLTKAQTEIVESLLNESKKQTLKQIAEVINLAVPDPGVVDAIPTTTAVDILLDHVNKNSESIKQIEKSVSEKLQDQENRLAAFIDVISERASNDEGLASCFKQDDCPFDPKIKKCPIWMKRPVRNDAPNFCMPCRLQKQLTAKGM